MLHRTCYFNQANNSNSGDDGGQHFYTIQSGPAGPSSLSSSSGRHRNRAGAGAGRGGKVVVVSTIDGSQPRPHRTGERGGGGDKKWFNLTIDRVGTFSLSLASEGYAC